MPNYNEKTVYIDEIGVEYELPSLDFFAPGEDRETILKEFIYIVRYNKSRASFPYPNVYDNVFRHLVHTDPTDSDKFVEDQGDVVMTYIPEPNSGASSNYKDYLPNLITPFRFPKCIPPPTVVDPAEIALGITIFTNYLVVRNLALDTMYSRSDFENYFLTNPMLSTGLFNEAGLLEKNTIANVNLSAKSSIYRALYSTLVQDPTTGNGFLPIFSESTAVKREFNELLNIKSSIGKYIFPYGTATPDLTNPNPESYYKLGDSSTDILSLNFFKLMAQSNLSSTGGVRRYNFSPGLSGSVRDQREQVIIEIRRILRETFLGMGGAFIDNEIEIIWRQLFPGVSLPSCNVLATGDGSNTKGLFSVYNLGAIFFRYEYGNHLENLHETQYLNLIRTPGASLFLSTYGAQGPYQTPSYTDSFLDIKYNQLIFDSSGLPINKLVELQFNIEAETMTLSALPSTGITVFPAISGVRDIVYTNGSINQIIAKWYENTRRLEFLDNRSFNVIVNQKSGGIYGGSGGPLVSAYTHRLTEADEIQSIICVAPNPSPFPIHIGASDLYRNDKFYMPTERVKKLLTSSDEIFAIDKIIDLILNENGSFENPILRGGFVGKLNTVPVGYDVPAVIADPDFYPATGSVPETNIEIDLYDKLRYSFAKIDIDFSDCNNPKIMFDIISYVSPRHSGLRDRLDSIDPAGHIYDYRNDPSTIPTTRPPLPQDPAGAPGDPRILPLATWNIANPAEHRGKNLENDYTTFATTGYKIPIINKPSYNQPLAMLRSFGLMEGIALKILGRTKEKFGKPSSQYTLILTKLSELLNNAESEDYTAEIRGWTLGTNPTLFNAIQLPNKKITFAEYQHLKWFALKSIFRGSGTVGTAEDPPPGPLQDLIIDGQQYYEYFEYDHDVWL